MAEEQKPVEIAKEAPVTTEPVVEAKTEDVAPVASVETTEAPATIEPVTEAAPAEAAAEEAKVEETKEEVKPIEEGLLEHKGQGANFPKNLLYTKKFFWFGSEPVDVKAHSTFKADKVAEVAHHVASWASETGKGLLFFSEKSDKTAPHGAIQLAEASEPVTEGTNKFHFTSKGHKHAFKASNTAERDNWVAQLKIKISEAKELSVTVPESEKYKSTLASLKPAPAAKKEEKAAAPAAESAAEETAITEEAVKPSTEEAAVEEAKKEEAKKEEPKRRSASRKRTSIFGGFLGKKDEEKKAVEPATETKAAEADVAAPAAEPSTAAAVEVPAATETTEVAPVATEEVATIDAAVETPKVEEIKEERPAVPTKRSSIFGNFGFGKKKTPEAAVETPKETPAAAEVVSETAPVIPAVDTTEPLSAEVASPATVPVETVDLTPAVNGEKKEAKTEKRKTSLPFTLGGKKAEKADKPTSDEESPKKKDSPFSKFRATIRGKKAEKSAEKTEETPAIAETPKEEETVKVAEPEVATTSAVQSEETPAKPLETTPVVAAAA